MPLKHIHSNSWNRLSDNNKVNRSSLSERPTVRIDRRQSKRPVHSTWIERMPLRVRLTLLIGMSLVGGSIIGMVEAHYHHEIWPLTAGLALLCSFLLITARNWVQAPLDQLANQLQRIKSKTKPVQLDQLPTNRNDEIGQIARVVEDLINWSLHSSLDARQLRRTMDHRVAKATQTATRHLEQVAMRDSLTGLANRRFMDENLEPLFEAARKNRTELVCFAIDLDNFKKVNDTLGHAMGDDLLTFIARLLQGTIRSQDYAIRLGGDEFVVLMPCCDAEHARKISVQLTTLFRQHVQVAFSNSQVKAGMSIGMATLQKDCPDSGAELLELADQRLYVAKRGGKNQVVSV